MLNTLAHGEGRRSDGKCRAKSRVPGFQARFSLFQSPQASLVSLLISVCTVFFLSVFLYLLVWMCWVQLLPWCHGAPAPGFSRYPFSRDVELLVRLFLMHVQPTSYCQQGSWLPLSQLVKAFFSYLETCLLCFASKGIPGGFCRWRLRCVQSSHQHHLVQCVGCCGPQIGTDCPVCAQIGLWGKRWAWDDCG